MVLHCNTYCDLICIKATGRNLTELLHYQPKMLPPYMSVDCESRAAQWTGVPSAVYKLDLDGLGKLNENDRELAVSRILDWMSAYENDHDAWVLTPSKYMFATEAVGASTENVKGTCIGNCMMPIRYSLMDAETSRRCLLTCADGAPYKECVLNKGDWTIFTNEVFYHENDKRCSTNDMCQMLLAKGCHKGPVVLTCFL